MRENFEELMRAYNTAIRADAEYDAEEREALLDRGSRENFTERTTQEHVYALQEEKRHAIDILHQQLRIIDEGGEVSIAEDGVPLKYAESEGLVAEHNGKHVPVSTGELITDLMWGKTYLLPRHTPRRLKKAYAIAYAKQTISALYDRQIALTESHNELERGSGRDLAYEAFLERETQETMPPGIIAERMVKSFLTKMMIDYDVPYTIEDVDIYEDVYHKIDFIITVRAARRTRGVDVESGSQVGIQFTTDKRPFTLKKKRRQIRRAKADIEMDPSIEVDDVVLVSIPLSHSRDLLNAWRRDNMPPGGPDKLWSAEIRRTILDGVLSNLLSDEELERVRQSVPT